MTPTDLETLRGLPDELRKLTFSFDGRKRLEALLAAANITALLAEYERRGELLKEILVWAMLYAPR